MLCFKNETYFVFRLTIVFSCKMDFHLYPFDSQKCSMDMESCKYFPGLQLNDDVKYNRSQI